MEPSGVGAGRPVCWCGEAGLRDFSAEYLACPACGTLVSRAKSGDVEAAVRDDEAGFYGKDYWLDHQVKQLGLPSIQQRARHDLPERCVYWLRHLLRFKPPPARILDVGCAHGGFVGLLHALGYDAVGLEVSPWVVDFAARTFGVPVLRGPLEEQDLADGSFDAVVLNDVVEHLPDPPGTLARCGRLLKPGGVLVMQMPSYPEGASHGELVARKDMFLPLMEGMAREHLHLFTQRSAERMLRGLGFNSVEFLKPLFPHDMYLAASRGPLTAAEPDLDALARLPASRLVLGMLDLDARCRTVEGRLAAVEADRTARLHMIHKLNNSLRASEADRAARQGTIQRLTRLLHESDADRAGRAEAVRRLQEALEQSEQDLANQRAAMARLNAAYQELAAAQRALVGRLQGSLAPAAEASAPRSRLGRLLWKCKAAARRWLGRRPRPPGAEPPAERAA